ncbi:hypothetical protein EPI10_015602 [Gossypium australe]|uniref:Uncharacterized protein n=1 Tax=Gossypium australe TaxID=47621 RepID=A0A5B6VKS3_9ROSI|nr:hypothetical protein EPI10_015602 [Gossypium australe]
MHLFRVSRIRLTNMLNWFQRDYKAVYPVTLKPIQKGKSGKMLTEPEEKSKQEVAENDDRVEDKKREQKPMLREYKPTISYPTKLKKRSHG